MGLTLLYIIANWEIVTYITCILRGSFLLWEGGIEISIKVVDTIMANDVMQTNRDYNETYLGIVYWLCIVDELITYVRDMKTVEIDQNYTT